MHFCSPNRSTNSTYFSVSVCEVMKALIGVFLLLLFVFFPIVTAMLAQLGHPAHEYFSVLLHMPFIHLSKGVHKYYYYVPAKSPGMCLILAVKWLRIIVSSDCGRDIKSNGCIVNGDMKGNEF